MNNGTAIIDGECIDIAGGTLCWKCANAVPSPATGAGCSWSRHFKPVRGWDAVPRPTDRSKSYFVRACPKFVPDGHAPAAYYDEEKRESQRAANRKYYAKDPKRQHQRVKAYREANPERIKAIQKRSYERHREKRLAYSRAYSKERYHRLKREAAEREEKP